MVIANDDLKETKRALDAGLIKSACYWAQQAIELFLKAFLMKKKEVFDPKIHKTHNLLFLARECYRIYRDFEEIVKKKVEFLQKLRYSRKRSVSNPKIPCSLFT